MELTLNEKAKYNVVRDYQNGKLTRKQAAVKLGVTLSTISVLGRGLEEHGKPYFSHKSKGTIPVNRVLPEVEDRLVKCYKDEFSGFNFTHFYELIKDTEELYRLTYGEELSSRTVARVLERNAVVSPRANRKRRKDNTHPLRPRRLGFGELVQLDASIHDWLSQNTEHTSNGREFNIALHLAIDDSDSSILGGYFAEQETLLGYYEIFHQVLTGYGIPGIFYTDRRTVFKDDKPNRVSSLTDQATNKSAQDSAVQFTRACHSLGVEIISTSVAQAKGRVERSFRAHQDRLVNELRREGIHSIAEANAYLPGYIRRHNARFALKPADSHLEIAFRPIEDDIDINRVLSIRTPRKVLNGGIVSFKSKQYYPVKQANQDDQANPTRALLPVDTPIEMVQTFDGQLLIRHGDEYYKAEFYNNGRYTAHTPPMTHPWKRTYAQRFG